MATETERLVYIIEVQDNGTALFGNISKGLGALERNAIRAFASISQAGLNLAGDLLGSVVKAFAKMGETVKEAVVDSIRAYADFEEQMLGARRTMDLTDESTKALMKNIQQLALNFEEGGLKAGVTTATLAEIAGIAGQMNITFEDGEERFNAFVETVAKASSAFGISAEQTASALGIISNVFGVPIEKAAELGGAITVIGNASVATVPELLNFMQRVGAVGASLGLTANQAAALGGMFREAGLSMEVAGTAVSNIFMKMQTELDKFAEVLAAGGLTRQMLETAINSKDAAGALQMVVNALAKMAETNPQAAAQAMKDLGLEGARSTAVLQSLVAQFPKFKEFAALIGDPMQNIKALNDAYEASLKGLNKQWDATTTIVTVLAQIIGEKLAGALSSVLEKYINPFLLKFQEWVQNSPVAQAILTELGRTIEIIGAAVGKMAMEFINWLNSLDTLAGQTAVHDWFAKFHSWLEKLINEGFGKVKAAAESFWNFLTTTDWGQVWRDIVTVLTIVKDTVVGVKNDTEKLGGAWDIFKMTLEGISDTVGVVLVPVFEFWLNNWNTLIEACKELGLLSEKVWKSIADGVGKAAEAVANLAGKTMQGLIDGLQKVWDMATRHSVFPDMVDWADKSAEAIGGITSATTVLGSGLISVSRNLAATQQEQMATWDKLTAQILHNQAMAASSVGMQFNPDEAMRQRDFLMRQQYGDMWSEAGARFGLEAMGTGSQSDAEAGASTSAGITINFSGENLVDEHLLLGFAQKIQKTLTENRSGLIGAIA